MKEVRRPDTSLRPGEVVRTGAGALAGQTPQTGQTGTQLGLVHPREMFVEVS